MPSFCQLYLAFDVPKVSAHLVWRFEFQRYSTLRLHFLGLYPQAVPHRCGYWLVGVWTTLTVGDEAVLFTDQGYT